ncbi:MAG: glycerol-3-phosphate 1-O-acyltransferase PlsY [Candidatus Melainabacteria bacterium]
MNSQAVAITLTLLAAYLIGSIPTGYIVARRVMGIDIREHGSGNVGATNVKRVVGNKAGLFTLVFDFFKGLVPVVASKWLFPDLPLVHVLTALAPVIGHSKSVFLGFTGGKSAITGLGGLMGLAPLPALTTGVIAFSTMKITRIVSVGTILAAICSPVLMIAFGQPLAYTGYALISAAYVIYLHRANIDRLMKGTENRI